MNARSLSKTLGAAVAVGALGFAAITACEGPAGPAGAAGSAGANGAAGQTGATGAQGSVGPQGATATLDGGLQSSCMAPCHGFNGIVEQWKTSTHYLGVMANTDEVPIWTNPGAVCGNCHASDGLPRRLAGQIAFAGDAGPAGLTSGQIDYKNSATNKLAEIMYTGGSHVATIGCTTCHDVTPANDPHVTGANYAQGVFKLRVPAGANDQALLEKSNAALTFTGTPAGKWGSSNTCVWCHKSRKDISTYIAATGNSIASATWGPHEAPHADIFAGSGGYHYTGNAYNNSTHQTVEGCKTCHMGKIAANGNYPDHSFQPVVASCRTAGCHASDAGTSFDISGGQSKVKDLLKELQALLNTRGLLTRSSAAPYAGLTSELGDGQYNLDRTRPGSGDGGTNQSLDADTAGALYNYIIASRGSAWGVHNPIYTQQLLWDSINFLKPGAPVSMSTRPHP